MRILSAHVKGYKSIEDSGTVVLDEEMSILAGKNNAGKSAFIESIYKVINGDIVNNLEQETYPLYLELVISVSEEELFELYKRVPLDYQIEKLEKFKIWFEYDFNKNESKINKVATFVNHSFVDIYENKNSVPNGSSANSYLIKNKSGNPINVVGSKPPQFFHNLKCLLKKNIIYINGSRYVPHQEKTNVHKNLAVNGENLNNFLYTLHNNFEIKFDSIVENFKKVFSDVASINTPINNEGNTYISINFEGMNEPIPLSNCGSGYTHTLLLLCVLFTKKNAVVLFDEPQVFLHPSAEKAIYDLISENKESQFIFTTHSPILINYPVKKNLYHVSKEKGKSNFVKLEEMQDILSDIGISNSDFALSDKVIFVEGETEEYAIPLILSYFGMKQIGYNYRLLNMKGTDRDFSKKTAMNKHQEKLELIMNGVSRSPIPYKIIIDSDNKTSEKLNEIRESYKDSIIILDRREYENYFLESYEELLELINSYLENKNTEIEAVKEKINTIFSQVEDRQLYPRERENPVINIVGSKVLEKLFESYSLKYDKIKHGLQLTELVLENTPERLSFFNSELKNFIEK
ncbi:ATP-dependent nuclease [Planococcus plakortidis]